MNPVQKHLAALCTQIDNALGPGRSAEILRGLDAVPDGQTPLEAAQWAVDVTGRLEACIDEGALIRIREACACIKANKYSAYNTKYFKAIRQTHPDDDDAYLQAVAAFLNGRGRCGKRVEYVDGRIISRFGFGSACVCTVIKGGWTRPPSTTWCRCCQGTLKSIYQFVFADKECHMDIVETFATGGTDCVFQTWYTERPT